VNRRFVYPGQIPRDKDILTAQTETMRLVGNLLADVLDSEIDTTSDTYVTRLGGFVPSYLGTMNMTLGAGRIYEFGALDTTAFGSVTADSRTLFRVGQTDAQTLSFAAAPATAGWSRIDLVQVKLDYLDTNNTVLLYYNSANPSQPYSGVGNNNVAQSQDRVLNATVAIKAGTAALSPTAPTPDAGYVALYHMTIAQGQTAVAAGNISLATNCALLAGLGKQHHTGAVGSAPKIQLNGASEVQGVLPLANGGTGIAPGSTQSLFNNISPLTTLGDTIYHNGTNVVRLAPPTAAKPFYLQQTGTGSAGAAPVWSSALTIANTTGGATPTDYMGSSAGNSVYMDASSGPVVVSTGDVTVILDSDNNATTNALVIRKNAGNTGATLVASINEDGNFSGQAAFVDDFGQNPQTTTGLTYGYFGGNISKGSNNIATVANGTIALTGSATNYVEVNPITGAVTANTSGFTLGLVAMAQIVTGAGSITTVTDKRDLMGVSDVPTGVNINPLANNPATTTALTFGYYGGQYINPSTNAAGTVSAGTIALSASSTNYVEFDPTAGVVVTNTSGFTLGRQPLYQVTTNAGAITAIADKRSLLGNGYVSVAGTVDNFMQNKQTTTGLTFGYYGGQARFGTKVNAVANGTVALTNTATNYIELDLPSATVSANTTGFTDGRVPLYTAVTSGGAITTVTDKRSFIGGLSVPMSAIINPYAYDPATTSALNFGYGPGQVRNDNAVSTVVAGTLALTGSTTNYVEANPSTGAISKNTTGFTAGQIPLYQIVTGAGSITSITDKRAILSLSGATSATAIPGGNDGKPNPSAKVLMFVADKAYSIGVNLAGAVVKCDTNPSANATFTVYKNGVSQGTFVLTTAGALTSVAVSAITLASGDRLNIQAPAVQDATLADLYITLQAT
jgi:hypothetical protein